MDCVVDLRSYKRVNSITFVYEEISLASLEPLQLGFLGTFQLFWSQYIMEMRCHGAIRLFPFQSSCSNSVLLLPE